jgi:hypothetical protein
MTTIIGTFAIASFGSSERIDEKQSGRRSMLLTSS